MAGGINAWNGLKAFGPPEMGMAIFSEADSTEDLIALAWILEDGSQRFYGGMVSLLDDEEAKSLFESLVTAEAAHKRTLERLYRDSTGIPFTSDAVSHEGARDIMEGGASLSEALSWAKGKSSIDLFQFSMSLEINAYDLYLKMADRMEQASSKEVFRELALEEEAHLTRMGELLGKQF